MKSPRHLNITLINETETTENQTLWLQWPCKEDPRIHLNPWPYRMLHNLLLGLPTVWAMPYTLHEYPQSHSGQGESTYNLKSVLMRRLWWALCQLLSTLGFWLTAEDCPLDDNKDAVSPAQIAWARLECKSKCWVYHTCSFCFTINLCLN